MNLLGQGNMNRVHVGCLGYMVLVVTLKESVEIRIPFKSNQIKMYLINLISHHRAAVNPLYG